MTIHWILEDQEYPLCSLFLTRGGFNLKTIVTYFQKVLKTFSTATLHLRMAGSTFLRHDLLKLFFNNGIVKVFRENNCL